MVNIIENLIKDLQFIIGNFVRILLYQKPWHKSIPGFFIILPL